MIEMLLLWVKSHGLWGVSLFMAAESGGLPLPTSFGFLAAEGMAKANLCEYWQAFLWILGGHLLGAGVTYYMGRAGDTALCRYLAHKPSVVAAHQKMQHWYARYGPLAVLAGRLVGHVRPWSSFIAGVSRVPQVTFWVWTIIGTAIFSAATMWITAVGYRYWLAHREIGVPALIIMLALFYGVPLYKAVEHLIKRRRAARLPEGAETQGGVGADEAETGPDKACALLEPTTDPTPPAGADATG